MLSITVHTTLASQRTSSGTIWFPFETEAEDMADVHRTLSKTKVIVGHKVVMETDDRGCWIVRERLPMIVGINAIATITPCHLNYREAGE